MGDGNRLAGTTGIRNLMGPRAAGVQGRNKGGCAFINDKLIVLLVWFLQAPVGFYAEPTNSKTSRDAGHCDLLSLSRPLSYPKYAEVRWLFPRHMRDAAVSRSGNPSDVHPTHSRPLPLRCLSSDPVVEERERAKKRGQRGSETHRREINKMISMRTN